MSFLRTWLFNALVIAAFVVWLVTVVGLIVATVRRIDHGEPWMLYAAALAAIFIGGVSLILSEEDK